MLNSTRRRFHVDSLISNLRWLLLSAVVIIAFVVPDRGFGGPYTVLLLIFIFLAAVYNLGVTLLLSYGAFPQPMPWITMFIDTTLTVGLMTVSGGFQSPYLFFGILPIITAALRFSFLTSLSVALIITLCYFGLGLLGRGDAPPSIVLSKIGDGVTLVLVALFTGVVGQRMQRRAATALEVEKAEELRRLRARHQQSRLIFELASTLSATLNYQRVLEAMLDVSEIGLRELMQRAVPQVGIVLLFDGQQLEVAASRHLTRRDEQVSIKGKEGIVGQALMTAEPALTDDPGRDPELGQFSAIHRCQQAIALPLRAGFESFGVVVFGSLVGGVYTADYQDLLVALCSQAVVALQNARLYQSLMEEKERIVEVEEDARKKLARDLHDGPTQTIAAIAMRVNYVRNLLDQKPDDASQELAHIEDLARHTTKEIRHMLFTLRPLILETQGLRAALDQYITKRAETDPLPVHLEAPEGVDQVLDKDDQGVIFYIIEEAISNARKHAQADNIWVRLRYERATFVAEVEDDGTGFDLDGVLEDYSLRGSLGMTNMYERTELVGGRLSIDSKPGQGTCITLEVPVEVQGA